MAGYIGSKSSVVLNAGATAAQGGLADSAVQPNDSPTFGTVTATSFSGDGSGLTGISAGATEVVTSGTVSSAVASINFTGLDFATYDYKLVLRNLQGNTDNRQMWLRVSSDNGSSWATLGYTYAGMGYDDGSAADNVANANDAKAIITSDLGAAATEYGVSGEYNLFRSSTDYGVWINGHVAFQDIGFNTTTYVVSAYNYSNFGINAFQIYPEAGSLDAGNYTLYRTVKS